MRKLVLVMAAVLAFVACGKRGIDGALDKLASFKDRICACKDMACVEKVRAEWLAWMKTHDELKTGSPSASQMKRGNEIRDAVEACEAKLDGRPQDHRFATALATMKGLADAMCACKDKACASKVHDELPKWSDENARIDELKATHAQREELTATTERMFGCRDKVMQDGAAGSVTSPADSPDSAPRAPHKPTPAGDGVEVLVSDTQPGASDLVVTDEYLFWTDGKDAPRGSGIPQNIQRSPHQRDASPTRLYGAETVDELVLLGDRLAWSEPNWVIFTMPPTGGEPSALVTLSDIPKEIRVHDGLVVSADDLRDPEDSRVFRVSERGEVTDLATVRGSDGPHIALDPKGALYVSQDDSLLAGMRPVFIGRVVNRKVVPIVKQPRGATLMAADVDALYYVNSEDHAQTLYRLATGAKKPQRLASKNENGWITALAVDEQFVYWAETMHGTTGKIWRLPKTGVGAPHAIADCGSTTRLVFYGPDLYWADATLNRIARARR